MIKLKDIIKESIRERAGEDIIAGLEIGVARLDDYMKRHGIVEKKHSPKINQPLSENTKPTHIPTREELIKQIDELISTL